MKVTEMSVKWDAGVRDVLRDLGVGLKKEMARTSPCQGRTGGSPSWPGEGGEGVPGGRVARWKSSRTTGKKVATGDS